MRLGVPTSARSAFFGRRIAVLAVASASLLTTGGVAFAAPGTSPGCSALNGGFSGGTGSGTSIGTGFNAGDIISLTITAAGIGDTLGLYDSTASTELVSESFIVGTRDYLVPAATGNTLAISGMRFDSASDFSWSCIPGSGGGGSGTDSDNLAKMQEDGWDWRALFSGYAWANAVYPELDQAFLDMAFNGGFGTSGTILNRDEYAHYAAFWRSDLISKRTFAPPGPDAPYDVHEEYYHYHVQALRDYDRLFAAGLVPSVTGGRGQGGIWQATLRWIEDPASAVSSYLPQSRPETANAVDEAFSALTDWTVSTTFVPYATTWADVRGTGFDSAANAQTGRQINTVAGVAR